MKKARCLLLMLVLMLSSVSLAYGMTWEEGVSPYFTSINYYTNSFNITDNGTAEYSLLIAPRTVDGADEVIATVKIINSSTKKVEYNKTKVLTFSSLYRAFRGSDSHQLSSSGTYEMQVTFRCYENGILLETINAVPEVDSF